LDEFLWLLKMSILWQIITSKLFIYLRQALKSTNTCPFKKIELETYVIITIYARSSPKKLEFNNSNLKWRTIVIKKDGIENFDVCAVLEVLGGRPKMFFELKNQRNNVWGFDVVWVLNCLLTSLSTLSRWDTWWLLSMYLNVDG